MFPVALFLAVLSQPARAEPLKCGNSDAQTTPLRTAAGFIVVLKMHSEDDHAKNTHLCMVEYYLQATKSGDARPQGDGGYGNLMNSDGDWSRSIALHIDGFSPDGNLAYITLFEGGKDPSIDAIEYDMRTGQSRGVLMDHSFLGALSPDCASALHIIGLSQRGRMVLAILPVNGCRRAELWELNYHQKKAKDGGALPETPRRLPSDTRVTRLDPGSKVTLPPGP